MINDEVCPSCKNDSIKEGQNYCPKCGLNINSIELKKESTNCYPTKLSFRNELKWILKEPNILMPNGDITVEVNVQAGHRKKDIQKELKLICEKLLECFD